MIGSEIITDLTLALSLFLGIEIQMAHHHVFAAQLSLAATSVVFVARPNVTITNVAPHEKVIF